MELVGGDKEFLKEVLNDLLNESDAAQADIEGAIAANPTDFECIQKAAHRIKGSAAYLCCEDLRKASYELQNAGQEARMPGVDEKAQLEKIKGMFTDFQTALAILRTIIAEKCG